MHEFLIIRLSDSGDPREAVVAQYVATGSADIAAAARQGYIGDGRYAVLDWAARTEFDLYPGPIETHPTGG